MTKCEEIGKVALVEVARASSSSSEAAEVGRKRKATTGELDRSSASQMRSRRNLVVKLDDSNFGKEESSSNDPCASCCSSNGSSELDKEISKFVDLEEERLGLTSRSTYDEYESWRERRESTPSSEIQGESDELESTRRMASEINSPRRSVTKKMPSSDEIDKFFSDAENNLQRQYAEKYNFDFAKEQPLEGRYNWVRVKP